MQNKVLRANRDWFIIILVLVLAFAIYRFSLCPTVYLIDSGELAAVSYTLGIAHPTGYPLYTLVSYFFAHLPGEPIVNLNVFSALCSLAAAFFLYLATRKITQNHLVSIISVSLYAFSPTVWRTSITNEVYPLTGLFVVLIVYLLLHLRSDRGFYLIMYLVGLSLTNHMTIVAAVLPIFCYIIISYRPRFGKILIGVCFFLLGFSLYGYLLTRTWGGAELAWGNTYNLQRLVWHITGKQYQVWMFSLTTQEIWRNVLNGLGILVKDFLFIMLVPFFIGLYRLFSAERKKFWLFSSIFILNFIYTINYSIPDVESYYMPGFIALVFIFAYGLKSIVRYLRWFVILPVALGIPIFNYRSCTLRDNAFGLDFGRAHIEQLPESSLLICPYWDIYSPTIYLRKVKHTRTDLVIIDKELLRRTWYVDYVKNEYPEFYDKTKNEIENYLVELIKFEYGAPYQTNIIQGKYIAMLESFIDAKLGQGVYLAVPAVDNDLRSVKKSFYRIPYGFVFRVQTDTTYYEFDFTRFKLKRPRIINDPRLTFNIGLLERTVANNILYLNSRGQFNKATQVKAWLDSF